MISINQLKDPHDLYAVERWVDRMADGTLVALDPATGERLVGPHKWIEAEPHLSQGAEFLGRLGSRGSVLIDGVVHVGTDSFPEDFEAIVASRAFGFEALPWDRSYHEEEIAELRSVGRQPHFLDDIWPPDPYLARVMDTAAASTRPSFGIDPGYDGTALEKLLMNMVFVSSDNYDQPEATVDITPLQRQELSFASGVLRHEYWPRKIGYESMLADVAPGDELYLLVGAAHRLLLGAQLETLYGLKVRTRAIASPLLKADFLLDYSDVFGRTIAQRRVTPEQLEFLEQEAPSLTS